MRMLHSCDWGETVPLLQQRTVSQFKTRRDAQRKRAGRKALPKWIAAGGFRGPPWLLPDQLLGAPAPERSSKAGLRVAIAAKNTSTRRYADRPRFRTPYGH